MGLMTGSGPLGARPAGAFNFAAPADAVYLEPTPKRVRAVFGGETVADSSAAMLLHESGHQPLYYFPAADVRGELLEASVNAQTYCPKKGHASYYTVRVGDSAAEDGAWHYPSPVDRAPPGLKDLIAFYWNRMEHWYEEDEEVFGHPRDPYHRIDVLRCSRRLRFFLAGRLLAQSDRSLALFESNLPVRWYLPPEDVRVALEPSSTQTRCPYKGLASYCSVALEHGTDLVWFYAAPLPEAARVKDLVCFYNEKVDVEVDGVAVARPDSPWDGARAVNRPPAETRG